MGILRFLLAVFVIAAHSGYIGIPFPNEKPYPSWNLFGIDGRQAVGIFFIISGFYMSMVLNTKYTSNVLKFYLNRFLRLWPTYLVSIFLVALFLNNIATTNALISNTSFFFKTYVWLSNIFILGSDAFWLLSIDQVSGKVIYLPAYINDGFNGDHLFFNIPVFTISIEILFYLIAPFILKSIKRVWLFFGAGLLYYGYIALTGNINVIFQYHLFPSSFLYFAMGALSWHYYYKSSEYKPLNYYTIVAILIIIQFANTVIAPVILLGFTFLTPYLFELTKQNKEDRFLGELSYPIYILHFPVILYLRSVGFEQKYFGITTLLITVTLAVFVYFLVEKPIDKWRQKIAHQ